MAEEKKKNWFSRHKVLSVILAVVVIGIFAAASSGGSNSGDKSSANAAGKSSKSSAKIYRFNDRADKQASDIEVLPNEAATIDGVKMTVSDVQYTTSIGEFDTADAGKTYVIATVNMENTGNKTQSYNGADFRLQTVGGQVLDTTISTADSQLNYGDLVSGGKVSGKVVFEVPIEKGNEYIIWKPNWNPTRAVVQVSNPN